MDDNDRKKRIDDKMRFVGGRPWTAEETAGFAELFRKAKRKKAVEQGGKADPESPPK